MKTAWIRKRLEELETRTETVDGRKTLVELEAWTEARKAEFNSPEAVEQRRKEYQARLEQGERFKQECYRKWGEAL